MPTNYKPQIQSGFGVGVSGQHMYVESGVWLASGMHVVADIAESGMGVQVQSGVYLASGMHVDISGTPVTISGDHVYIESGAHVVANVTVIASNITVDISGDPVTISGDHVYVESGVYLASGIWFASGIGVITAGGFSSGDPCTISGDHVFVESGVHIASGVGVQIQSGAGVLISGQCVCTASGVWFASGIGVQIQSGLHVLISGQPVTVSGNHIFVGGNIQVQSGVGVLISGQHVYVESGVYMASGTGVHVEGAVQVSGTVAVSGSVHISGERVRIEGFYTGSGNASGIWFPLEANCSGVLFVAISGQATDIGGSLIQVPVDKQAVYKTHTDLWSGNINSGIIAYTSGADVSTYERLGLYIDSWSGHVEITVQAGISSASGDFCDVDGLDPLISGFEGCKRYIIGEFPFEYARLKVEKYAESGYFSHRWARTT